MLFWRQGCLLFFELGQKPEIWKNPPIGQTQEASRLGQKTEIWGIPPNGAVTGSKLVGAKTCNIGKFPN